MGEFLAGDRLTETVGEILREETCKCAVAFWGNGAREKLAKNASKMQLICNLKSGGTNPFEIEKLPRSSVRQSDTLHAKVYIGDKFAVVSSANLSANGLGLEGVEQAYWIEAGAVIDDTSEVNAWFDRLWDQSSSISDDDLEQAKLRWSRRQRSAKPSLSSLAAFDPGRQDVPLLYWITKEEEEFKFNEAEIKAQLGSYDKNTRDLVADSLEVARRDRKAMAPGRWILVWHRHDDGKPEEEPRPYWFFTGRLVDKI